MLTNQRKAGDLVQCIFESLHPENGSGIKMLSDEDSARFLKSMQLMNSLNLTSVFQGVTPSEMSLIYAVEEFEKNKLKIEDEIVRKRAGIFPLRRRLAG